ncbi:sulfatase [Marssonina coronariae]|uniref:Sulfatase n=1 Tax=Diplocarpon coronariae TaxID=2795749 RepID=A0A218ZCT8_9HELO|nr:sulfatase [Marssonina coronariae]
MSKQLVHYDSLYCDSSILWVALGKFWSGLVWSGLRWSELVWCPAKQRGYKSWKSGIRLPSVLTFRQVPLKPRNRQPGRGPAPLRRLDDSGSTEGIQDRAGAHGDGGLVDVD